MKEKKIREKEKMLVSSIFSSYHIVLKSSIIPMSLKPGRSDKWLNLTSCQNSSILQMTDEKIDSVLNN